MASEPVADSDALAKTLVLYNGPLLIGTCIDWMLFGLFCLQIYYWIQTDRYKHRKKNVMLTIVVLTTAFQTAQLGLVTATTWRILVQHWGNPLAWVHTPSEPAWNPPLDGMTALLVQWFFAWRIVVLSPHVASRVVVGLVFALSLIQCAGSWATGVMYYNSAGDFSALSALDTTVKLMIIASLSADIIIALTVCTLLYTARRRTRFRSSAAMIDKLMANVVESGMITAIVVLVELIMYLNYQHSALFTIFNFIAGKSYSNVLLASLNTLDGPGSRGSTTDESDNVRDLRDDLRTAALASSHYPMQARKETDVETDTRGTEHVAKPNAL